MTPQRADQNIARYPWFKAFQSLLFWQAVWFLFFQDTLSASQAIVLYAFYDLSTTMLEVPSGYMSDRVGRRPTLIMAALTGVLGSVLLTVGDGFAVFACAQILLGAAAAFASGTDSSMLFESLKAAGRAAEVEAQEVRAWRFSFAAFAVSAVSGGAMAMIDPRLSFAATTLAMLGMLALALGFSEPPHHAVKRSRLRVLSAAFQQPVLRWLFVLSLTMYAFSHIPFVFGQPFILQTLAPLGLSGEAPLVSGAITAVMMLVSVAVSLVSRRLRRRVGLPAMVLLAFGLQIAVIWLMSVSGTAAASLLLLLRMVPDSLAGPFVQARLQPLLNDAARATYLSLQSLGGRLLLSLSLLLAAGRTADVGGMPLDDINRILAGYAALGALVWVGLAVTARRVPLEPRRANPS